MVSVIIISFNTKEITLRCLGDVYKSKDVDLEVIVVDNNSTDGSIEAIKKEFPQVKVIANKTNEGFAKANNQGMRLAKGDYLLLLNSDCFVKSNTISTLLKAMEALPQADLAGSKLLNADSTTQYSWGYFPTLPRIAALMMFVDNLPLIKQFFPSIHVRAESKHLRAKQVDWVMGALVLLRRKVWEKTEGFDEKYFMYGEEMEWMYRIKRAGYKLWYIPQAEATHIGGASSPDKSPAIVGEMIGWKYWFKKYNPKWQQVVLPFIVSLGCILRMVVKPERAKFYRQALTKIW